MDMQTAENYDFQTKLERYKQSQETQRILIKSIGSFALHALRGIFLLNGGAGIAMIAHVQGAKSHPESVTMFAVGALLAVVAAGSAYISELLGAAYYVNKSDDALNGIFEDSNQQKYVRNASLVFTAISVCLFLVSCVLFFVQVHAISNAFSDWHAANATVVVR